MAALGRCSRATLVLAALAILVLIGVVDYLSGFEVLFSVFYLVEVALAAWFVGRGFGLLMSVLSVVVWIGGDVAAGAHYSNPFVPIWNALILMVCYFIVVWLLTHLRALHRDLESKVRQRTEALEREIAERQRLEDEILQIGERLTLGALTRVEVRSGLARIMREGNERRIAIKLSVRGRDLGSLVHEAEEKAYAAVKLPPGYHMVWTGAFENQQRAAHRLTVVVPLTIIAIYFLLFTAFDSGKFAALILLNVPFAAIGGLLALPIARLDLSVSAMVRFIALFGVLLVERVRELRRLGYLRRRMSESAAARRPASAATPICRG